MSIDTIINNIITTEGGYVNDPKDKGGPTKYGITKATLSKWLGTKASIDDVKSLTKDTAYKIYYNKYYLETKINELPEELQEIILDITVNSWIKVASLILQRSINKLYGRNEVIVDGKLGKHTIEMAKKAIHIYGLKNMINCIVDYRIEFYKLIVENNKSQEKFLKGWINRAEKFRIQ